MTVVSNMGSRWKKAYESVCLKGMDLAKFPLWLKDCEKWKGKQGPLKVKLKTPVKENWEPAECKEKLKMVKGISSTQSFSSIVKS